jgi:replicative DNA helicase
METELQIQLNEITAKVKKLKTRTARLESENEALRKSVFGYLQQLEQQKKESEKLSQSIQNDKISQSIASDKKSLQKELDKYILMIDKCIAAVEAKI